MHLVEWSQVPIAQHLVFLNVAMWDGRSDHIRNRVSVEVNDGLVVAIRAVEAVSARRLCPKVAAGSEIVWPPLACRDEMLCQNTQLAAISGAACGTLRSS